jgi:hypothetical protein
MAGVGVGCEMKQFRSNLSWMAVDSSSSLSTTAEKSSEHCALLLAERITRAAAATEDKGKSDDVLQPVESKPVLHDHDAKGSLFY